MGSGWRQSPPACPSLLPRGVGFFKLKIINNRGLFLNHTLELVVSLWFWGQPILGGFHRKYVWRGRAGVPTSPGWSWGGPDIQNLCLGPGCSFGCWSQGRPELGRFAKKIGSPQQIIPRAVSPRAVSPHRELGPPALTLLFPLCLRRTLRTQQPPLSVVAHPRPSPPSPLGHQALLDLQAQRDVTAQPLPQLQHGESWGTGGHRLLDPSSLQGSLFYVAPLLERHQIIFGLVIRMFGCWTLVQCTCPSLGAVPAQPAPLYTRIIKMVRFNQDQLDFALAINSNKVALESSSLV